MHYMVNWDYWNWKKRRLPVIARPATRSAIAKKSGFLAGNKAAFGTASLIEVLESVAERIGGLESRIDGLMDEIPLPVMSVIDQQNDRIMSELGDLRESMIINNKEMAELLAARQNEKETKVIIEKEPVVPVVIKDRHMQLIRLLMNEASAVDYAQISRKLGVAKSSVRVYVSDLKNLGFPFLKKKAGGKVLIKLNPESYAFVRELLGKYGMS